MVNLADHSRIDLTHEWIIVCEGHADKEFFQHLIDKRGLPAFDVPFPREGLREGGRPAFSRMLSALRVARGFDRVSAVLIVSDNDDAPADSFNEVRRQIREARDYGVPDQPLLGVRTDGMPCVVVLMLPEIGQPGCLETLCLSGLRAQSNQVSLCLDEYARCTGIDSWPSTSKKDKARLQCMSAALSPNDPNRPLRYAFSHYRGPLVRVTDRAFDTVAEVLRNFGRYVV
jgi:hypothetical protein